MKTIYIYKNGNCYDSEYFCTTIKQKATLLGILEVEDNVSVISFGHISNNKTYSRIIIKNKDLFLKESLINCINEAKTKIYYDSYEYI